MHLKDLRIGEPVCNYDNLPSPENDVSAGKGQLQIPTILKEAVKQGVKHVFIEDESSRVLRQIPETIQFVHGLK